MSVDLSEKIRRVSSCQLSAGHTIHMKSRLILSFHVNCLTSRQFSEKMKSKFLILLRVIV